MVPVTQKSGRSVHFDPSIPIASYDTTSTRKRTTTMNTTAQSTTQKNAGLKRGETCAILITTRNGKREVIAIGLDKVVTIGRHAERCSYVVDDAVISGVHCKVYAVRSPHDGVIVSCQDVSRNGIMLNSQDIKKTSVILMDGDILKLPGETAQEFYCTHVWRQPAAKLSLFEPTPPLHPAQKHIGAYSVTSHCLGTGSFATVHLALDPSHHRQVACKSIRTKRGSDITQVMKEVRILMGLKHPNINEIYDSERSDQFIHIFLQLCTGGDLFTYITVSLERGSRICEAEAKYIMFQILRALKYLHDKQISHRDLKPENILLHCPGSYPRVLIADFGLARPNACQETFNVCGTVSYLPPEGIMALDNKNMTYVGMPSDCWSAGVILYVMLCGGHPFDQAKRESESTTWISRIKESQKPESARNYGEAEQEMDYILKQRIVRGQVDFYEDPWAKLPEALDLVASLLCHDLQKRATVDAALGSKWIQNDIRDLKRLYKIKVLGSV